MNTDMHYEMFVPTRTLFGAGTLNRLGEQKLPGKKALLMISNGKSTRASGTLARTEEQLRGAGVDYVIFDKVEPNPLKTTVMAGGAAAREHACDFIVALGGGSVMDAAKGVAVVATNDGDLWDYVAFGTGKGKPIANRPLPIVAVTTTAGTGSETDAGGVITNAETREKTAIHDASLFPVLAVVDPELTTTVPAKFTAFQGFDALFHSTEAYISRRANLMSDMYALTAIEHIAKHLPRAVRDGNDLKARTHVSWGNTLSGSVMCVGSCTSEHSLEHALSAFHQELPHGAGLIMISQAYYAHFIRLGVRSERFVKMAKAMGVEDASVPEDFLRALEKLRNDCGVGDLKMSDYGITPDEFPKMARNAKDSMGFLFPADPAPLSDEDCVAIYRASYK